MKGDSGFAVSRLWAARSIAVIGASDRRGSLGRLPIEHLLRYGFTGKIYPVRPDGAPVAGLPSYRTVQDCPMPVELAMIMVPAERVGAAVDDCAAAGVQVAIVCSSGFAETGAAGAAIQDDVVRRARAGGVRVVGPNCIGSVGVSTGMVASFSPLFSGERTTLVAGSIGFASQSGALGYGAVSLAFERGLGLGWIVNTGNEADINALEVMAEMAGIPDCVGVIGYVESLDDGPALRRLAHSHKPVALLKAGRSRAGQQAATSHTGALATEDRVVDAALRQLGIARADDVEELLDFGDAFAQPRRPQGSRVAVVTTSGGSGILAADAIDACDLELAEFSGDTKTRLDVIVPAYGATDNPVDVTATVMTDSALFRDALDAIVDDPSVDAVVACFCVLTEQDVAQVVSSLARAAERSDKPVLVARTGADHLAPDAGSALRSAGVPAYSTPARAVRALAALRTVTVGARDGHENVAVFGQGEQGPTDTSEPEVKAALAAAGLTVPEGRTVTSATAAADAVAALGGRAVLKAVVPGLVHKTEAGGVAVGVTTARAAETYEQMSLLGKSVLVEEMVSGGVEVLVGVSPTPLGSALSVGVGGTLAELIDDVAIRLLPTWRTDGWRDELEEMIDETRVGTLLAGARGAGSFDRDALVDSLVALTLAVRQWPRGFELDLNPVAVLPVGRGVCVLDAAYVPPAQLDQER